MSCWAVEIVVFVTASGVLMSFFAFDFESET
jgi:hypothetical protein